MSNLFLALFLLSPIGLVIGLIKPKFFSKFLPTRKKIALAFGGLTVLSFILFGATVPPTEKKDKVKVESQQVAGESTSLPETPKPENLVKVIRVIDGDTIEIEGGKRVRFIGIDTPETLRPGTPVQCYGKEASTKTKELLERQEIKLEKDVSEVDRYGRLLRYVWKGDTLINELLVKEGFAQVSTYPPDVKYNERLLAAQKEARDNNRGLWSSCQATPKPTASTTQTQQPTTGGNWTCSCSKTCTQMSSCAEAQYQLNVCGCTARDADHDGIACDSQCQ